MGFQIVDYVFWFEGWTGLSCGKNGTNFGIEVWVLMDDGFGGLAEIK